MSTKQELTRFVHDGGDMEMPRGLVNRLQASADWHVPSGEADSICAALFTKIVLGPHTGMKVSITAAELLLDMGVTKR